MSTAQQTPGPIKAPCMPMQAVTLQKSDLDQAKFLLGFDYGPDLFHVIGFDFGKDDGGAIGIWRQGDEFCARITLDALANFWANAKTVGLVAKAAGSTLAPAGYQPLAVTDLPRFPTMLRQMYSGGAVQSWIDDNIKPLIQERHHAFHCDALAAPVRPDDSSLETGEGDAHGN